MSSVSPDVLRWFWELSSLKRGGDWRTPATNGVFADAREAAATGLIDKLVELHAEQGDGCADLEVNNPNSSCADPMCSMLSSAWSGVWGLLETVPGRDLRWLSRSCCQ